MKILEINKFNYLRRGAEKHFLDVAGLLKSRGHEVAIFSMDNPKNDFSPWKKYFVSYAGFEKNDSWFLKLKGLLRIYSFEAKRKMGKLLDDFQPDIVHIHNIYHHISPSILGEIKRRGIPIVMTIHDYNLVCPNYALIENGKNWEDLKENKFSNFVRYKYFKNSYIQSFLVYLEYAFNRFFGFYERTVAIYIAPSKFVKDKLVANGMPAEKIIVLPHFTRTDYTGASCDLRSKEEYAFYFGSIAKDKNVDRLIEIFENSPQMKLYLAGNIAKDFILPKTKNIKYLGFLNQQEIEKYIRNSLFVVSASRLPETFGLIALEAISNAKPFIGLADGALGEIIENNKQGYICKTEDEMKEKISKLWEDTGLRILFSRQALERAKNFNEQGYYEKIIEIFKNCSKK
jgi:glycosyltransferase involved in cell wall biosynthesis